MFRASTRLVKTSNIKSVSPVCRSFTTQQPIKRTTNLFTKKKPNALTLTTQRTFGSTKRVLYQGSQQASNPTMNYLIGGAAVLGLVGLAATGMSNSSNTLGYVFHYF